MLYVRNDAVWFLYLVLKQACRDENVVSLFIFTYNNQYIYIYILIAWNITSAT